MLIPALATRAHALEDTLELRERLALAWRSTLDGVIERGAPEQAAVETMVEVAHARFAESFGPAAAANYLQLLAEQLRDVDRNETAQLMQGETPAPTAPTDAVAPPQAAWVARDALWD